MGGVIIRGKIVLALVSVCFVLSGCAAGTVKEKLREADTLAGELLDGLGQATSTPAASSSDISLPGLDGIKDMARAVKDRLTGGVATSTAADGKTDGQPPAATGPEDLTLETKGRIDLWLEANGYNRYGDQKDTYYAGGTPLFDERTGEAIDRFEYIFEKHPDILTKI